ncbi:hypothetical protein Tco_1554099 [Tanacetum coccineum]
MGSNEEIVQLLQKTQTIFKQTQRDKEEKYLNDSIQLQDKIKDLENVVCKMGRSTDTLRLLTSEQKAFKDNLHKSGVGYNGPFVLSQAYAKIPKLYRTSELCDKNEQLHVFDYEETLEDAEKRLCSSKELSAEQTYFSSSFIPCVKDSVKILETKSMPNQLLEASLTEDIKNLVITSCMEIRNKDLHDEIERISKESNDVSFEVTQGLSNLELWELEIYCQKSEAKKILALSRENQAQGVVKPEIRGNVNFKIKSQFMRELREDTFSENKDEDAHDHIDWVLSIVGLFNIPKVSLTMQSGSEFFPSILPVPPKRLGGPFPEIRPIEALTVIQTMADHSQKWHDGSTSRNIKSSSSNDGLAALVGCQICEGPHLEKDCPLNEVVKQVEEVRYGEFGRTTPFNGSNGGKFQESARRSTEMDVWIKKLKENAKINIRNQDTLLKNLETQIEQLTKELHSKKEKSEEAKVVTIENEGPSSPKKLKNLHIISFLSDSQEENTID